MVLLGMNAFGHQCTTTKWVWYYYDELSIEETTLNVLYVGLVLLALGIHCRGDMAVHVLLLKKYYQLVWYCYE